MIKRFMYVEDGSIDLDRLEEELAEDTKIITYRQSATPPIIEELVTPAYSFLDSELNTLRSNKKELIGFLTEIFREFHTKEAPKRVSEILAEFCDKYGD